MGMPDTATISTPATGITTPFFQISVTVTTIAIDPQQGWDMGNTRFYLEFADGIITPIISTSSLVSSPYKK